MSKICDGNEAVNSLGIRSNVTVNQGHAVVYGIFSLVYYNL